MIALIEDLFSEQEPTRLKWIQTTARGFELLKDHDCLATLEWPHPISAHAHGRTADGTWDIRRLSLFGPYVRVANLRAGAEVAHFGKATLEAPCVLRFHDGSLYHWRPLVTVEGMSFETAEGKPIVDFRPKVLAEQHLSNVSVYKWVEQLPLLLLVGWYVLEMEYREDINLDENEFFIKA
jgi:hypothetical protein